MKSLSAGDQFLRKSELQFVRRNSMLHLQVDHLCVELVVEQVAIHAYPT